VDAVTPGVTTVAVANQTILTSAGANGVIANCPCGFVVSGTNTITGNQGTNVFLLTVEMVYDLIDFRGGNTSLNPIG